MTARRDRFRDAAVTLALAGAALFALWRLYYRFNVLVWCGVVLALLATVVFRARPLRVAALATAATLLPLASIETGLRWVSAGAEAEPGPYYAEEYSQGYVRPHALGYVPPASEVIHVRKLLPDGASIYDVHYTIDAHGYRRVPGADASRPAVLFFGGSFMFGEGLEDEETIPAQMVANSGGRLTAANLALHGYGTHQVLRSLELGLPRQLGLNVARVVYLAGPWHLDRIARPSAWDAFGPRYRLDSHGRPRFTGPFTDPESRWQRLLRSSEFYARIRGVFDPSEAERRALGLAMIAESAALAQRELGAGFTVLLWPNKEDDRTEFLAQQLAKAGLEVIAVGDLLADPSGPAYTIEGDGHPNAAAARVLGEQLAKRFR